MNKFQIVIRVYINHTVYKGNIIELKPKSMYYPGH